MHFQQLPNKPALFIPESKILVVTDLHIGIENELRKYGVHTASHIIMMEAMLMEICTKYKPKDIILLGDIKHTIPSAPFYEKKQIFQFFHKLSKMAIIHIVPGNHDGWIKTMVPEQIKIHRSDGFSIHNLGFIHGHRWPSEQVMNSSFLFCGHTHPTIKLTDRLGYPSYESCWVKTPVYEKEIKERYQTYNKDMMITILPVFNPLCGGISVNVEGFVGPIQYIVHPQKAEIYLLDGSFIGTLNNL